MTKNTQQQIQDITDKFYNKHPELKKLEFGVQFFNGEDWFTITCNKCIDYTDDREDYTDMGNWIYVFGCYADSHCWGEYSPRSIDKKFTRFSLEQIEEFEKRDSWEIRYKPITTLQAISLLQNKENEYWHVDSYGMLYESDMKRFEIDPTLPLLRDQSPQVIEQLWELIVKK